MVLWLLRKSASKIGFFMVNSLPRRMLEFFSSTVDSTGFKLLNNFCCVLKNFTKKILLAFVIQSPLSVKILLVVAAIV